MTAALPLIARQTQTTLTLYRSALLEIMADRLWSWDKLAGELRADIITLKRFMQHAAPENANQAMRERWLLAKIDTYLVSYQLGPKPQPTRKIQTPSLEYRR